LQALVWIDFWSSLDHGVFVLANTFGKATGIVQNGPRGPAFMTEAECLGEGLMYSFG
jgi:hypothetical protein